MNKVLGIIPARYASTRFPGKPLADILGKSMIQRVYEGCLQSAELDKVVIATDDQRIFDHVLAFGGEGIMTRSDHLSGTDRVAEVAQRMPEFSYCINIQGDEPLISPSQIDELVQSLIRHPHPIATLIHQIDKTSDIEDTNIVKVVCDHTGRALYFSRSPIPFIRNGQATTEGALFFQHIGIYGFERDCLIQLSRLKPGRLERLEGLEQLRWLEHGYSIQTAISPVPSYAVDRPADIIRIEQLLKRISDGTENG